MASKEANRLKYQYNKKYVDAYWERKALQTGGKTAAPMVIDVDIEECPIRSDGMSDEFYIKCLEERNRRLLRLLESYQRTFRNIMRLCHEEN